MQIAVMQQEQCQDPTGRMVVKTTKGKLSMIDLAGSERASNTDNRGLRMTEGASINRSLLALANCINALQVRRRGVRV